MIRLESINKIYHGKDVETHALSDIHLTIEEGEYIAIVGTSGSGKTTLLNILGAMTHPTSGTYFYRDMEVTNLNQRKFNQFRKEHISFVFQHFELMDRYNVYENIEMPLLARGIKQRKKIVDYSMEILHIENLAKKTPSCLSGGEKQRCAIARALAAGTDLILADEPTGALDGKTTDDILTVFDDVHQLGRTIVLITHDPKVANHCDRIINIEDGRLTELPN